jgi:hypothetical protein
MLGGQWIICLQKEVEQIDFDSQPLLHLLPLCCPIELRKFGRRVFSRRVRVYLHVHSPAHPPAHPPVHM